MFHKLIMKNKSVPFLMASLFLGSAVIFPGVAEAIVIGEGSIDWNWTDASRPDGGLFPHTSGGPFGRILETKQTPPESSDTTFYFDSDYDSSGSVGDSTVTAKRTPSDNTIPGDHSEGTFTAKTNDPNISVRAQYGFGEYFNWYDLVLPGISVDYAFQGMTDSENDELFFVLQFALTLYGRYVDVDPGGVSTYGWDVVTLYSDYDGDPSNGENLIFEALGANQEIDESGTKIFVGELSALDYLDQDKTYDIISWFGEYDFGGYGVDYTNDEPPVAPEPTTLALMGLGLAGIGWKRRKAA